MEEESWRRKHVKGIMGEEPSRRRHLEASGAIWEASGLHLGASRRKHLEASGAIWEASRRQLGGTWEASGAPRASGGIVGAL